MHKVRAKSILSNDNNMNIYRGCSHGCIYCDSRSLCYNMQHRFEDIEVKENALDLLEDTLKKKRKKVMIFTGSMSDPYIPQEKELQLTRGALEIVYKYGFGITLLTKSDLILRDMDLIKKINRKSKCVVQMTLTCADDYLSRIIEPNVCTTTTRAKVLKIFSDNGISCVAWINPILPFILDNEENINKLIDMLVYAKVKGVVVFGFGMTLRSGNREYYYYNLDKYFPSLKQIYINQYSNSYSIVSPKSKQLLKIFNKRCKENNIMNDIDQVFSYLKKIEKKEYVQLSLF